jgi:hypothetical protein
MPLGSEAAWVPAPRFVNTDFILEDKLLARLLADLHWLRRGQILHLKTDTLISTQIMRLTSNIHYDGKYSRLAREVWLSPTDFYQPAILSAGAQTPVARSLNTCTLFFDSDGESAKPIAVSPLDMSYLEEADSYNFSSMRPGRLGEKTRYTVRQNTPLIEIVDAAKAGIPIRFFAQLKRLILLEEQL